MTWRVAPFFIFFIMKKIALTVAGLLLSIAVMAQNPTVPIPSNLRTGVRTAQKKESDKKLEFFVGGNINSNFGYNLALAPELGVHITDWFSVGAGPRYELSFMGMGMGNYTALHAFGASVFTEFLIARYFLVHAGYEFLNYPSFCDEEGYPLSTPMRKNNHALALGIGFKSYIGTDLSLYALYVIYPTQPLNKNYNDYYAPMPMFARVGITYDF